jgi:hypothetical protein
MPLLARVPFVGKRAQAEGIDCVAQVTIALMAYMASI